MYFMRHPNTGRNERTPHHVSESGRKLEQCEFDRVPRMDSIGLIPTSEKADYHQRRDVTNGEVLEGCHNAVLYASHLHSMQVSAQCKNSRVGASSQRCRVLLDMYWSSTKALDISLVRVSNRIKVEALSSDILKIERESKTSNYPYQPERIKLDNTATSRLIILRWCSSE